MNYEESVQLKINTNLDEIGTELNNFNMELLTSFDESGASTLKDNIIYVNMASVDSFIDDVNALKERINKFFKVRKDTSTELQGK